MNRRAIAASTVVTALAATCGVVLAVHAHGGSAGVAVATSAPTPAAAPVRASATSAAAPAAPLHVTVAPFHFSSSDFKFDSNKPSEVVMPQTTIHPGASSQWHTHPGPGFVVVTAGTVTLYQVIDNTCEKSTYGPGQGWVEGPGIVHLARNDGTTDVTLVATFLDVAPGSTAYKSVVPAPSACPGIK